MNIKPFVVALALIAGAAQAKQLNAYGQPDAYAFDGGPSFSAGVGDDRRGDDGARDSFKAGASEGGVMNELRVTKERAWDAPHYGHADSTPVAVPVAAVPEPETYALMLAGVGAIIFMARRRRS